MQTDWRNIWTALKDDRQGKAIFSLIVLNGFSPEQLIGLPHDALNLQNNTLTSDTTIYPLVSYAADALNELYLKGPTLFSEEEVSNRLAEWQLDIVQAHRRLAGAIWYTSEEGSTIREVTGVVEEPNLPLRFIFPFSILARLTTDDPERIAEARVPLQIAADWLVTETLEPPHSLLRRLTNLLSQGQTIFLISSTGVNAINLLHNLVMGRLLSPAAYGQLTLIITIQLFVGLLPTAIQTVTARFGAGYAIHKEFSLLNALKQYLMRWVQIISVALLLLTLITAPLLADLFKIDETWLFMPIALSWPFLLMAGVDRGILQSLNSYRWLSGAYLTEGIIRLGIGAALGFALLDVGRELDGAVWGVAQSLLMTWFISWLALRHFVPSPIDLEINVETQKREWSQLGGFIILSLLGQALITNSDFLLVKNLFSSTDSGLYAAISVLGRIAYFGALPLTVVIVPIVARQQALGASTRQFFWMLMISGGLMCGALLMAAVLFSELIVTMLYGAEYSDAAYLLPSYTIAASLFVLTNLAITYQVALGKGDETWMPFLAGVLQIIGILIFHESLLQVILVQIVLMTLLLIGVLGRVLSQS